MTCSPLNPSSGVRRRLCGLAFLAALLAATAHGQYRPSGFGRSSPSPSGASRSRTGRSGAANSASAMGQVYAVPEEDGNTILIVAPPRHMEAIQQLLRELDKPRAQVLIQAMFVEVALDDSFDWEVSGTIFRDKHFIKELDRLTGRTFNDINSVQGRFDYSLAQGSPTFQLINHRLELILTALKSVTDINIVSRPQILVSNNESARFFVGENTPFVTRSQLTDQGQTINTIQYEEVGVDLQVVPQINEDGIVDMQIMPEISRRSDSTIAISEGLNASVFPTRFAQTVVSVRDGQTIVAGGLIENREIKSVRKVPILGSIPLLGWLFRGVNKQDVKTELLIFITPKVVMNPEDLQVLSESEKARAGVSSDPPASPERKKKPAWW